MKRDRSPHGFGPGLAALVFFLVAGVASAAPPQEKGKAAKARAANAPEKQFAVPTPPFTPGIFPCSECHKEMKPNPKRRELKDEHTNIVLNHAQGQRWCLDCHDISNRDKLHLVSGEKIGF
jgi:cbb3-type cytochrome oxidase subunit 3